MVAIYVLKLSRGKYYVGMTRKNIDRVLAHIDGKGAAWTKKYPPSGTKPILSFYFALLKRALTTSKTSFFSRLISTMPQYSSFGEPS